MLFACNVMRGRGKIKAKHNLMDNDNELSALTAENVTITEEKNTR